MRADQLLVARGMAASRAQAARLIAAGVQWRAGAGAWQAVAKNGDELPADAALDLLDAAEARYVSRGGLKLEGALRATGVSAQGRRCLDVGQSTGGFTDCLLRHGAAQVLGVDVGHGQLHPRLRADARVLCLEGINARSLDASVLIAATAGNSGAGGRFDANFGLVVGDVSFISLTLVLPALAPLLAADGDLLLLVKPQFELQPGQIGKGGIVRDTGLHAMVEQRIRAACADCGLAVRQWLPSPIAGGDGNREFFVHARRKTP
ncbi:TlyA family RNA methyltransferase [Ramlibacter sp. H39-3-26]|uniref:TlyA family RNA methyltransferase n=1 Tax=Curvibacter soli TaxID=3031331 RepID=UPI0023DB8B1D|nr:TlyA family RNA methyltransferase [Ramlibacter sp. H39-3-26]MDF1484461.1 TlyA family RNA methyltransferase [Ramlibacter sp. H39-3-26]